MKHLLPLLITLITAASSCSMECSSGTGIINFVGLTEADLDTVVYRRFAKGSDFNELLSSDTLQGLLARIQGSDTTAPYGNMDFAPGFDVECRVPATGQVFHITEVRERQTSRSRRSKTLCINPITSVRVDDRIVSGEDIHSVFLIR